MSSTCYLHLHYKQVYSGGYPVEEEEGPFVDREPTYVDLALLQLYRDHEDWTPGTDRAVPVTEEVWNAPCVYLVVPRYRDGDTFGTTHGLWTVTAITTTLEEAKKIKAEVLKNANDDSYEVPWEDPWNGYFSKLESVEIHEMKVEGKADQSKRSCGILAKLLKRAKHSLVED